LLLPAYADAIAAAAAATPLSAVFAFDLPNAPFTLPLFCRRHAIALSLMDAAMRARAHADAAMRYAPRAPRFHALPPRRASAPAVYYADTAFRSLFSPLIFDVIFAMTLPPPAPVIYACWLPLAAPRRALRCHCLPAFAASRFSPWPLSAGYAACQRRFRYCRATLLVAIILPADFRRRHAFIFAIAATMLFHFAFAFLSRHARLSRCRTTPAPLRHCAAADFRRLLADSI
jgi:hypothetical protein